MPLGRRLHCPQHQDLSSLSPYLPHSTKSLDYPWSGVLFDGVPVDVRKLFRSPPTKADLKASVTDLKEELHTKTQQIRGEIANLRTKVEAAKVGVTAVETRMTAIEQYCMVVGAQLMKLHLRLEEQVDRGRRKSVRINGLPVVSTPQTQIEKMIRLSGLREGVAARPGAVVCYLAQFSTRDKIIQRAWNLGPCDLRGAEITIMPELSTATLRRR